MDNIYFRDHQISALTYQLAISKRFQDVHMNKANKYNKPDIGQITPLPSHILKRVIIRSINKEKLN